MDWTLLIWTPVILAVGVVSFFLALRSMKDYEELPKGNINYSLYLIGQPQNFNRSTLEKIYQQSFRIKTQVSFEKLIRGEDKVLTVFLPEGVATSFPELGLLPIEDYISPTLKPGKFSLKQSYVWSMEIPKNNLGFIRGIWDQINLREDQFFSFQIVAFPEQGKQSLRSDELKDNFQVTLRGLVSFPESVKRVETVKTVQEILSKNSNLKVSTKGKNTALLFENFFRRTFVPKEVLKTHISSGELFNILS